MTQAVGRIPFWPQDPSPGYKACNVFPLSVGASDEDDVRTVTCLITLH